MSKLVEFREKLNLTQNELAEKSGLSVRTIQRIEAGAKLKGHSLRVLSQSLNITEAQLIGKSIEELFNYRLIKIINLSSLPFVIVPIANIAVPLLIMYFRKEVNQITHQIVSLQIFWTITSGVLFLLSPFIARFFSMDKNLTLGVLILSILVNVFIIIRNTAEIDRHHKLRIKLNFNFI